MTTPKTILTDKVFDSFSKSHNQGIFIDRVNTVVKVSPAAYTQIDTQKILLDLKDINKYRDPYSCLGIKTHQIITKLDGVLGSESRVWLVLNNRYPELNNLINKYGTNTFDIGRLPYKNNNFHVQLLNFTLATTGRLISIFPRKRDGKLRSYISFADNPRVLGIIPPTTIDL